MLQNILDEKTNNNNKNEEKQNIVCYVLQLNQEDIYGIRKPTKTK